jgi:hypothetical protein
VKSFRARFLSIGLLTCAFAWGQAQEQQPPENRPAPPGSSSRPNIQAPPAPPPRLPDVRQPGETGWWIGLNAGFPTQHPYLDKGRGANFTEASRVEMQGKPKYAAGLEVGMAVGLHNTLRFAYFDTKASGNIESLPNTLRLWDQTYEAGTYLATNYRLQHGKMSLDYLTWPYPVESRRFRLKTLWQVQWTQMKTVFDAPKKPLLDDNGFPIVDSAGNPISYAAIGSRWFVSPMFGVGAAYYAGRHFRWEANAAGWTWPRRNTVWDAETSVNLKYGHFELRGGIKAFHFKTSTEAEFYGIGTLWSGFAGVRWYSQ